MGYVPGVTLTKWRTIWAERFPRSRLDVIAVAEVDQRRVIDAGEVDLCFVRLPIDPEGLHLIPRYQEVPVVVMPKDDPLAEFSELTLADLPPGTLLESTARAEDMDRVAQGHGVILVPQSIARTWSRRDLTYLPVTDAGQTTIGLAWSVDNDNESIQEFIGIVRGRTVNSSRTQQARAAKAPAKAPSPAPRVPGRRRRGRS